MALPDKETIEKIIKGDTKRLVKVAGKLGLRWGRDLDTQKKGGTEKNDERLTRSQIRNIFNSVKRIEMHGFNGKENEFLLLKPKLAYAAARPGKTKGVVELEDVLSKSIDYVENEKERFENFCNFFEAILAYHRAAGGK
jgi:CRISPR-associated protein Csm2